MRKSTNNLKRNIKIIIPLILLVSVAIEWSFKSYVDKKDAPKANEIAVGTTIEKDKVESITKSEIADIKEVVKPKDDVVEDTKDTDSKVVVKEEIPVIKTETVKKTIKVDSTVNTTDTANKAEATRVSNAKAEAIRIASVKAETARIANAKAEATRVANAKAEATRIANAKAEKAKADAKAKEEIKPDSKTYTEAEIAANMKADAERYFAETGNYQLYEKFRSDIKSAIAAKKTNFTLGYRSLNDGTFDRSATNAEIQKILREILNNNFSAFTDFDADISMNPYGVTFHMTY
jgi:hypothetical protein